MKKKLTEKLLLNKETISKLQDEESRKIKGGLSLCDDSCSCKTDDSCSDGMNCCPTTRREKIDQG
ncbi:MAG: class I lanthipeptide [Candidatus Aminicenantes bacterium]|nr:class I lanthipeptide [Candidatus Aminicenantes bacterium]